MTGAKRYSQEAGGMEIPYFHWKEVPCIKVKETYREPEQYGNTSFRPLN